MSTKLNVVERPENQNPRQIRNAGFIPVSVYGKNMDTKIAQVNTHEFEMAYKKADENSWELALGSEKINAKIAELQKNHATGEFLNIEFHAV